jgi:hypothetical protein
VFDSVGACFFLSSPRSLYLLLTRCDRYVVALSESADYCLVVVVVGVDGTVQHLTSDACPCEHCDVGHRQSGDLLSVAAAADQAAWQWDYPKWLRKHSAARDGRVGVEVGLPCSMGAGEHHIQYCLLHDEGEEDVVKESRADREHGIAPHRRVSKLAPSQGPPVQQ